MRILSFSLFSIVLLSGCGSHAPALQFNEEAGGSPFLFKGARTGFAPWGGVGETEKFHHLADPSGILLGQANLTGAFQGAMGIDPSEILGGP